MRIREKRGLVLAAIAVAASVAVSGSTRASPAFAPEAAPTASKPGAAALDAQIRQATTAAEPRSMAWLGCWEPVAEPLASADAPAERICVLPGESIDAIRMLTLEGDEVVLTTPILADGTRRDVTRGGCSGWETGRWTADGRRILLRAVLDCEGGLQRVSSGILAMLPGDEWLDVQAIDAGGEEATHIVRYRSAPVPDALASELGSLLDERRLAIQTARADAALGLTLDDVTEAVRATNEETVTALLLERGEGFDVDADELVAMRRAGVSGAVTDLVVALSFPDRFTIAAGGSASPRPQDVAELGGGPGYEYARGRRAGVYGSCLGYGLYDPWGWYGLYPYGFGSAFGSALGCSPFSYGSRYGLYGRYGRGAPIIIIQEREPASRGRMVRGEGYRGDTSIGGRGRGGGDRRATPRTSRSPDRSSSPPPRTSVGRRGGSADPPTTSSSSGRSGRTAKRRGGGGGN